jgi:hypothetical protein
VAEVQRKGKRKREQWLEAQTATGHSKRPQDEYGWQIDNSDAPFKGVLEHWRRFVQVISAESLEACMAVPEDSLVLLFRTPRST